ncbi:hypothetical protein EHS25_006427 [Saitozyma podzolica]|uniref:Uncharacterized protein n=1 Tax=Saitozyma podzolica TaxID=1890683 RepID=A0A427YRV0_9TREE|nr:hypothetical protein EHS25_006427 [Saitozyma podzolica]
MSSLSAFASNPLLASTEDISKSQSIAFCAVYGVFVLLLAIRLIGRVKRTFAYALVLLFAIVRVATFAIRADVATLSIQSSDYGTLLIVAAVFVIAGFLFLIEAIFDLLVQWLLKYIRYCALKARDLNGKTRLIIHLFGHIVFVGISVIGIIGAVNESNDVSSGGDLSGMNTAKRLRQASGALFLLVIALFFVITFYLLLSSANRDARPPRKAPAGAVMIVSLVALALEAVYRIWSASSTTGFIIKQTALDVLVVMPELVVLVLFVVLNMDDMGDVRFVGVGVGQRREAPQQLEQAGDKC